jgi:hypothetical protein
VGSACSRSCESTCCSVRQIDLPAALQAQARATFCCASNEVAYPRHCDCSTLGWFVAAVRRASWPRGALHTDLRDAIASGCVPGIEGARRPLKKPIAIAGLDIRKWQMMAASAVTGGKWRRSLSAMEVIPTAEPTKLSVFASHFCSLQLKPRD